MRSPGAWWRWPRLLPRGEPGASPVTPSAPCQGFPQLLAQLEVGKHPSTPGSSASPGHVGRGPFWQGLNERVQPPASPQWGWAHRS